MLSDTFERLLSRVHVGHESANQMSDVESADHAVKTQDPQWEPSGLGANHTYPKIRQPTEQFTSFTFTHNLQNSEYQQSQ